MRRVGGVEDELLGRDGAEQPVRRRGGDVRERQAVTFERQAVDAERGEPGWRERSRPRPLGDSRRSCQGRGGSQPW